MLLLALDSSHSEGSLCLQKDGQVLEFAEWKQEKSHAELIAGILDQSLKNHKLSTRDIDAFAVNIGPGSFTGIRISVNTIKTLGFVHQKPIYAFNSLETIAESSHLSQKNLVVAVNAHSELCYVGRFMNAGNHWASCGGVEVLSAKHLNDLLKAPDTCFAGDAFEIYKNNISTPICRPKTYSDIPNAKSLNQLVHFFKNDSQKIKTWETLEPFYVRLSSPEEKLKRQLD